jgi:hypothetical protein
MNEYEVVIPTIVPPVCELWKGKTFIGYIRNELELNDILIQIKQNNIEDGVYHIEHKSIFNSYPILKEGKIKQFHLYNLIDEQIKVLMDID